MAELGIVWLDIKYFLALNLQAEVFWNVLPIILCTILIIAYFTRYKEEKAGWNTYFSNSLVLIFVSINLFRYIYSIGVASPSNYLDYPAKSIAVLALLTIGMLFTRFNFGHLLPERYARYASSPLSINLIAYAVLLYVYSTIPTRLEMFLALLAIVLVFGLIFEGLRLPLKGIFILVEKEKERERFRDIKEAKLEIDELERDLKSRKKELGQIRIKQLEKEKKTAIKLEKAIGK